jgi:hypothetical protein
MGLEDYGRTLFAELSGLNFVLNIVSLLFFQKNEIFQMKITFSTNIFFTVRDGLGSQNHNPTAASTRKRFFIPIKYV